MPVAVLTTKQSDSNFGTKLVDSHSMKALVSRPIQYHNVYRYLTFIKPVRKGVSSDSSAVRPDSPISSYRITHRFIVLINAAFAFIGSEITAIAAAETSNVSVCRTIREFTSLTTYYSHEEMSRMPSRVSGLDLYYVS